MGKFYLPRETICVREVDDWVIQGMIPRGFELRIELLSSRTFGAVYFRRELKKQC